MLISFLSWGLKPFGSKESHSNKGIGFNKEIHNLYK